MLILHGNGFQFAAYKIKGAIMKYILLFTTFLFAGELEVDGDLKVTGTIQNDSLAQVIANLQAQITALQNHVIQLECINNGVIPE